MNSTYFLLRDSPLLQDTYRVSTQGASYGAVTCYRHGGFLFTDRGFESKTPKMCCGGHNDAETQYQIHRGHKVIEHSMDQMVALGIGSFLVIRHA